MSRLSLDNPFFFPILISITGLIGFIYIQISIDNMNKFSILFILLTVSLVIFYLKLAIMIDKKKKWNVKSVSTPFALTLICSDIYLTFPMLIHGPTSSFEERLEIYGSSFLFGIKWAISSFLFPIIPVFAKSSFIRKFSFYYFILSYTLSAIIAPSKSVFLGLFFNLLVYRFLKRKSNIDIPAIPVYSVFSVITLFSIVIGTLLFLYIKVGDSFLYLFLYRISMNYDTAIFGSLVQDTKPEHGIIFYIFLPLLKRFYPELYELEYYNIPQFLLYQVFGIERYGRYAYPNDNFIVGSILSYGYFLGSVLFFISLILFYLFINIFLIKKERISTFSIYMLLNIPTFFSSAQDFAVKVFTMLFIFYTINTIVNIFLTLLPKGSTIKHANNLR